MTAKLSLPDPWPGGDVFRSKKDLSQVPLGVSLAYLPTFSSR